MIKPRNSNLKQRNSDDQLNEQINDKLSELWTGMKNKKKQMLRNLTPNYSRRTQHTQSQLNVSNPTMQLNFKQSLTKHQKANENYLSQVVNSSKKSQLQRLKQTILQLTNDKKNLLKHMQSFANHQISINQLNQSSINHNNISTNVDGRTANFSLKKKKNQFVNSIHKHEEEQFDNINQKHNINQQYAPTKEQTNKTKKPYNNTTYHENKQNENTQNKSSRYHQTQKHVQKSRPIYSQKKTNETQKALQTISKSRLIQLLRSTAEYRQFAFYYDSHQLSYLKRLQDQHKKNCTHNASKNQKKLWAPTQLVQKIQKLNKTQRIGLNQYQIQSIISEMKFYFQENQQIKIKKIKQSYQSKLNKLMRQKQNNIPYDLIRLSNAKQRTISNSTQYRKNRSNTFKN